MTSQNLIFNVWKKLELKIVIFGQMADILGMAKDFQNGRGCLPELLWQIRTCLPEMRNVKVVSYYICPYFQQ